MKSRDAAARGGLAAAACVACCALPIIAALGVTAGVAATVGISWAWPRRSPRSSSARRGPRRGRGGHETKLLSRRRWRYLAEDSPDVVVLLERGDEPVFVAGSLAWGIVADGFRPDRWDYFGATICLAGVAVIMFAPRTA